MKVTKFEIDGPLLVEPKTIHDDRGFFTERYRVDVFAELGIENNFVQENYSLSAPGVLRGLHYQHNPPQGKLITCTTGRIFDVAVDIRRDSLSYGKWISVELDAKCPAWFWIPAGFAHGFCVLGDEPAGVLYKVDCGWNKDGEGGFLWNDSTLNICWPIESPRLSDKDRELPHFAEVIEDADVLPR